MLFLPSATGASTGQAQGQRLPLSLTQKK